MKKTMIITLVDGTLIEKDLTGWIRDLQKGPNPSLPLNPGANHEEIFNRMIMPIVAFGFEQLGVSSPKYRNWIAPSQIKTVEIIFAEQ